MATVAVTSGSDNNDPTAQRGATCIPRCSNQWNISHLNGKMFVNVLKLVADVDICPGINFCFVFF